MAITWPMYVVVGAAPAAYLGLFGPNYIDEGLATVVLMSVSMLFNVATGAADTLLLMSGRSGLSLCNSLSALALDIGLCLWFIPFMGISGAALAWAVSSSSRCVLAVVQVRITLGIVSFGRAAGIVAAANVGCIGLPLLVLSGFVHVNALTLLPAVVVCGLAYAGVLWMGRGPLMLSVLRGLIGRSSTALSS